MRSEHLTDRPPIELGDPPAGTRWRGSGSRGWDVWQVDCLLHPSIREGVARRASRRIMLDNPTRYIAQLLGVPLDVPTSTPLDISDHPFAGVLASGYAQQMPLPLWLVVIGAIPLHQIFSKNILDHEGIALCQPPYVDLLCSIHAEMYRRDGRSPVCPPLTRPNVHPFARDPLTTEFFGMHGGDADADWLVRRFGFDRLRELHPDASELELAFIMDAPKARLFLFSNATQLHPHIFSRLVRAFGVTSW